MTLSDVASISGKGNLFKVLAPAKSGVILESLDEAKTKIVATTNHKMSLLSEISIYTTTKEGTVPLDQVLKKMHKEFGSDLGVDGNSDPGELKAFLKSVLAEYDEERVYVSDIRKLVKWYAILLKNAPEIFEEKEEKPVEVKKEETGEESVKKEEKKAESKKTEKKEGAKKEKPKKKAK